MIVFYDLETTGLIHPTRKDLPGIVQINAQKYATDGRLISEFNYPLVNPELTPSDWEAGAIKTTGISPDDIPKDTPSFYCVAYNLAEWLVGTKVLAGYNIHHFDDKVLYRQLKRYGFEKNFPWPPKRLDVMVYALQRSHAKGKRGNKPPKLEEIYKELFDRTLDDAHDASADVTATAKVAFEICKPTIERLMK